MAVQQQRTSETVIQLEKTLFNATTTEDPLASVIALEGELDMATVSTLRTAVLGALDSDVRSIVLDMRDLAFIDSSGLCTIVGLHERARRTGVKVVLRSPSPLAARIFSITGQDEVLTVEAG